MEDLLGPVADIDDYGELPLPGRVDEQRPKAPGILISEAVEHEAAFLRFQDADKLGQVVVVGHHRQT